MVGPGRGSEALLFGVLKHELDGLAGELMVD